MFRLDGKSKPEKMALGLRHYTREEIESTIKHLEDNGYLVTHKTKGLPFNGMLSCRLEEN